jgi:hypothetical protein
MVNPMISTRVGSRRMMPIREYVSMAEPGFAATAWLYGRSFIAVLAGLLIVVILSIATDEVMHATGIIPPGAMWNPWHNALALAYRSIFTVAGGYATARLAPRARMTHVVILALIGTAAGIAGVIATAGMNLGPRWYPIALAVTAFPLTWAGGWLYLRHMARA